MKNQSLKYLPKMSPKPTNSKNRRTFSLKDMDETHTRLRQRSRGSATLVMSPSMVCLPLLLLLCGSYSEACSSRLRNRNRPPTEAPPVPTTLRPPITFDVFECPPSLDQWFCLNKAACFAIKVGDVVEYNCNCTEGFMGRRCEHKYVDIDGELLSRLSIQETLSEYAGLAGATTYILFIAVAMGVWIYLRRRRHRVSSEIQNVDEVDGLAFERPRPFGPRRNLDISMERLVKKPPAVAKKNGSKKDLP